eukprot:CAMPEP_0116040244 /NCGR_PEP_ID=MMETSP0321-20121206/24235_1 /TAXON_ID=163516 /ORGANISM="Leptocylindrus danicus var. danicus, Strain B650" /LENGTH=778 /DNA_ID=CAMNT_0003520005 /DNA_START=30 /DNA_END=2363 /DNA_ORIENTATION=+
MNAQYGYSSVPPPAKKTRPQNTNEYMEKIAKRKEELAVMKQRIGIKLNEPIVGNLAPYRGGTAVHRNPVTVAGAGGTASTGIVRPVVRSAGLNGTRPTGGGSVMPPPAYVATSAGARTGTNNITSGPPPPTMATHAGLPSPSSSKIPRYADRNIGTTAAVPPKPAPVYVPQSRKQSNLPPPPTPNTVKRAEEALSNEKPVNSKKEMIYLMNTYGQADVNASVEKAAQPKAMSDVKSAKVSHGVSKPVSSHIAASDSANVVMSNGTHAAIKEKNGSKSLESSRELKLLKMLNQEKESRKDALEKLAKSSKNYKMFALLFSKIINRNLNATKSKVFAKIRENSQQKRGVDKLDSLEEMPKFEMTLNQHVTHLGTYTIRTADMSKLYQPEVDNDSYKAAFTTTNFMSISVRAKVAMDDSVAILVRDQVYHSFDETNWSLNVTGRVGYINDVGDEGEYDFDQVIREMRFARRAFLDKRGQPYQHVSGEVKPMEAKFEMGGSTTSLNSFAPPTGASTNIPPSMQTAASDKARPNGASNKGSKPPSIGQFPLQQQQQQQQQKNNIAQQAQQTRVIPPMPSQARPVLMNPSEAPSIQTVPAQSKPLMANIMQPPEQMARKMPEDSDLQEGGTTLPPPINRISPNVKPMDRSTDVQLPPLKNMVTSVEKKEQALNEKAASASEGPVLVKQPRISVEYLEIKSPPNRIISLLFLPSRMMLKSFRTFLYNMILLCVFVSLWIYFAESPTLLWAAINVPSDIGGPHGYFGSLSLPEVPDEVEKHLLEIW